MKLLMALSEEGVAEDVHHTEISLVPGSMLNRDRSHSATACARFVPLPDRCRPNLKSQAKAELNIPNDDSYPIGRMPIHPNERDGVLERVQRAAQRLPALGYESVPAVGWSEPWLDFCIRLAEIDIRLVGLPKSKWGSLCVTVVPIELADAMRRRIDPLRRELERKSLKCCEICGRTAADAVQVTTNLDTEFVATRCTFHPVENNRGRLPSD